ncbi:MAG: hypothetical protein JO171_02780 [Paludibacterium sp.]|uniref:hypothetical protein n=1 Tax=Paludibacterium sp. TaxID=1917523 RepID=UPI0025CBBD5A|nr:hypothetical protein [Paludibacterium sp.]MBV8046050.1 hypothetical protein [Paludibacterium sp.]MBV8646139.1 hypothetical protein [Paludibacterium sp.]
MKALRGWLGALMVVSLPVCGMNVLDLAPGMQVEGEIQFNQSHYPLPKGEWTVVLATKGEGTIPQGRNQVATFKVANVLLAHTQQGQLVALLRFRGNATAFPPTGIRGWKDDPCNRAQRNLYLLNAYDGSFSFPECLTTQPVYGFAYSNDAYFGTVTHWLTQHGISVPGTLLYSNYSRYGRAQFMQTSLWISPSAFGYQDDDQRLKDLNKWTAGGVAADNIPLVEALNDLSGHYADALHHAFDGEAAPAVDLGVLKRVR